MIAVLGDVLVDIVAQTQQPLALGSDTPAQIHLLPGGSAAGTAAWLAHDGHSVRLLAAVGDDALADVAITNLGQVDLALQRVQSGRTGSCVVIVDPGGERTMLPDAGASSAWQWRPQDLDGVRHLHVSAYPLYRDVTRPQVMAAMGAARDQGLSVSLDLASAAPLAENLDAARAAIRLTDIVLGNVDEAHVLTGSADPLQAVEVMATMVPTAVVKRGSQGCLARRTRSGISREDVDVEGLPFTSSTGGRIDTTGAGDAFTAGFLPLWLANSDLVACVHGGQVSAVRTLGRVGAGPPAASERE